MPEEILDYEPPLDADVPPAFSDIANDLDGRQANLNSAVRVTGVCAVIPFTSSCPGHPRMHCCSLLTCCLPFAAVSK